MDSMTASEVADSVDGELIGDPGAVISGVASLAEASASDLSFLGNDRYRSQVLTSPALVVLVPCDYREDPPSGRAWIQCADPSAAFTSICARFQPPPFIPLPGVHATAVVADSATVPDSVHVAAKAVIGDDVRIGPGSIVEAGCVIGAEAVIGADCRLRPNVTVLERTLIGDRVIIHSGTVIGSDGYGYVTKDDGHHEKIPQSGIVQIDDDVEVGANVCIDRARFGRTWIKCGAKIDNLVQIAHNVVIGERTLIVSATAIAGSCVIGNDVIMAGRSGLPGHVHVGNGAILMGGAVPFKDVPAGATVLGFPAQPRRDYLKQEVLMRKLGDFYKRIEALEQGQDPE